MRLYDHKKHYMGSWTNTKAKYYKDDYDDTEDGMIVHGLKEDVVFS